MNIDIHFAVKMYLCFVVLASNSNNPKRESDGYTAAVESHAAGLIAYGLPFTLRTPHFLITVTAIEDES